MQNDGVFARTNCTNSRTALSRWRSLSLGPILAAGLGMALLALAGWSLPAKAGPSVFIRAIVTSTITPTGTQTVISFLPILLKQPSPTPTPSPTPSPTPTPTATLPAPSVSTIPCDWFPSGPTDRDWAGCVEGGVYEIQRWNISFSMVACCPPPATHYAIEASARLVQGEGDYRIGFDVVSFNNGGGYLFGINPRNGTYSLYRIDNSDWKGGIALIGWTPSNYIQRDLATNQMRVERNQATITLFINGQQVASLEDSTYQHTGIGWTLYVRNYSQPNSVMQFTKIDEWAWP